jgi:hypothetical protein
MWIQKKNHINVKIEIKKLNALKSSQCKKVQLKKINLLRFSFKKIIIIHWSVQAFHMKFLTNHMFSEIYKMIINIFG